MEFAGKIASDKIFKLQFLIGGRLAFLDAFLGKTVKKGELLARLDQTELQAYLERALKYYEQVRSEFDEKQQKSLSEYEKRKIQAELEVAVKNVEIAKANLEATNIFAPTDGIIVDIDSAIPGVNITPGGFLISLLDHQSFYFEILVSEEDLEKIKPDLPAKIALKAFPQKVIGGRVIWKSYLPDKEGFYSCRLSLDDQSELRIGLSGTANIG